MLWIVIVILILGFLYFLWYQPGTKSLEARGSSKVYPKTPLPSCPQGGRRIELPLKYDSMDGVYKTWIRIGDENKTMMFEVTPDTGSSMLLLGSSKCDGCNGKHGLWDESIGQNMAPFPDAKGVIRYGGGQVTTYIPWRARFYGGLNDPVATGSFNVVRQGGLNDPVATGSFNVVRQEDDLDDKTGYEVDFGLVTSTISPDGRPLYVLGLQETPGGFLEGLCGKKTVTFDFRGGKMILGPADDVLEGKTVIHGKLANIPTVVKFNAWKILSMKVDGQAIDITPNYAIVDTGTTNTIVDSNLDKVIRNSNKVEITIEGGETITFTNRPGSVVVDRLPIDKSMIIGNRWLQDYTLMIKHDTDEMLLIK